MYREQSRSPVKQPIRSWRAPGVHGIRALAPKNDPAFDVAGLPNPFSVYFPVVITNLYTATIYVTALLISPPAGWTDSEQNLVTIAVGANARTEKSNPTRAVPATPANESVTVRYNYRTGSYAGTIIGFDEFTHAIYYEDITTGTIDATDDFENPLDPGPPPNYDGWTLNNLVGTLEWARDSTRFIHGAYSLRIAVGTGEEGYLEKELAIGAGSRAYIFGFEQRSVAAYSRLTWVGPVESLEVVYAAAYTWRRQGIRLNPGEVNNVRIYMRGYWGGLYHYFDYLRWVHW